jgi:DNA-binding response OmpR family regulator
MADPMHPTGTAARSIDARSSRPRILVVEGETKLARNIARFIERRGCSVAVAGTLSMARRLFADLAPAVVIAGYDLPDGNGLLLLQELSAAGYAGRVVMISGQDNEWIEHAAIRSGAARLLYKPVPLDELFELVSRLLA